MGLKDSLNLKATAFANRWRLVIKIWLVFSFLSYALAYYFELEVFGFISAISIFGCVCLLAFSSLLWFIASLVFLQPLVFLLLEKFDESITIYALACAIWLLGWITLSLVVDDKFARLGNDILLKVFRIVLVSEFALLYFLNYNNSLDIETLIKSNLTKSLLLVLNSYMLPSLVTLLIFDIKTYIASKNE
ncbi:nitrogen fixation protein NifR [Campylobacter concisus]|uniref:nitrogen fixation protein NifR n=1 Tax=Campylobacter concisus TaxID=199 RepID=UPI0011E7A828|nr:nitrogen fixation protein NifR [Campylobacter concisus]